MGCLLEWCCRDCGAGESFLCGGGFSDFNPADVVEQSRRGDFGPALKALLGNGIPKGWSVRRENSYYECPFCGGVVWVPHCRSRAGAMGGLSITSSPTNAPRAANRCRSESACLP